MNNNYEVINVRYYDLYHTLFKPGRNDREYVNLYKCSNKENCDAYKNGTCILNCGLFGHLCPYGKREHIEGFTKSARNCGKLIYEYKTKYADKCYKLKDTNHVCKIGDYWYLNLPWLDCKHYVNYKYGDDTAREWQLHISDSIKKMISYEDMVNNSYFTVDFIKCLIDFRPLALMGGVIDDYYNKKLPQFLYDLRKYYPEKYNEVLVERPEIEELANKVSCKGKKAKLKTLSPGNVELNSKKVYWDGNKIVSDSKTICNFYFSKGNAEVMLIPDDDFEVTICDDSTVNDDTVFV